MLNLDLIKSAMHAAGLNQAALARQLDVSREAVSNWLTGEALPRPKKLKALAEALTIELDQLVSGPDSPAEPMIAFRTLRNARATQAAKAAALDVAQHLLELVPFIERDHLFAPPVLEAPKLDDAYVREAARQVRSRVEASPLAPLTRTQLVELHRRFGSLLVPVPWQGERAGHENALSVYLPDSKTSWVLFNLNARSDDFHYWLAHELGHCYTLHTLNEADGEAFAERFAQELLFPLETAANALADLRADGSMARAEWWAGTYGISVVTVIRQADRAARARGEEPTGLESDKFWRKWSAARKVVPRVSDQLCGTPTRSLSELVHKAEETFPTPVFDALAQWQRAEGGRSPAFLAATLNLDLGQALELSYVLAAR